MKKTKEKQKNSYTSFDALEHVLSKKIITLTESITHLLAHFCQTNRFFKRILHSNKINIFYLVLSIDSELNEMITWIRHKRIPLFLVHSRQFRHPFESKKKSLQIAKMNYENFQFLNHFYSNGCINTAHNFLHFMAIVISKWYVCNKHVANCC